MAILATGNFIAPGSSSSFAVDKGVISFAVWGTVSAGSIALQRSTDAGVTWVSVAYDGAVTKVSLTSENSVICMETEGGGVLYRVLATGSFSGNANYRVGKAS